MRTRTMINWATGSAVALVLLSVVGTGPAAGAPTAQPQDLPAAQQGHVGISAGGRFNDTAPHFGGAHILPTNSTTALQCTAGFAVFDANGFPASVTAGHCAPNNVNYSSGGFYGQIRGQRLDGARDMARLEPLFQTTYSPVIHTGPTAPVTRVVRGKADPADGALVCVSGALTEAKCNLRVLPGTHSLCYFTHSNGIMCTHGLRLAERLDTPIVEVGDSGGPVYTRSGSDGAIINGMIIGRSDANHVYFHPVSAVESGLNVRVMTA